MTAVIATKASPPGLFSTTTGWPHFAERLSAKTRAVMSTPEPGPSGMIKCTGRCGQLCANDDAVSIVAKAEKISTRVARRKLSIDPPLFECERRLAPLACGFIFFGRLAKTNLMPIRIHAKLGGLQLRLAKK